MITRLTREYSGWKRSGLTKRAPTACGTGTCGSIAATWSRSMRRAAQSLRWRTSAGTSSARRYSATPRKSRCAFWRRQRKRSIASGGDSGSEKPPRGVTFRRTLMRIASSIPKEICCRRWSSIVMTTCLCCKRCRKAQMHWSHYWPRYWSRSLLRVQLSNEMTRVCANSKACRCSPAQFTATRRKSSRSCSTGCGSMSNL